MSQEKKQARGPGRRFGSGENNPRYRPALHGRSDADSLASLGMPTTDSTRLVVDEGPKSSRPDHCVL